MESEEAALLAARDHVLTRMVEYFLGRAGTRALFLSGSVAAGTADAYSDLDFRVVVAPEHYEAFLSEREWAPSAWGELLFNQVPPGSQHSVSHFRPLLKVDTFYYRADRLAPSPWFTLPTQVLFDPEGLVRRAIEGSRGLEFVPPPEAVEHSIAFGLAAVHEIYRRARRGELVYAQHLLDELRWAMVDADDALHRRPAYGFSHFETRAAPDFTAMIHASYCSLEEQAVLQSLARLADVYRSQVSALHQAFPLSRDLRTDLAALDAVILRLE